MGKRGVASFLFLAMILLATPRLWALDEWALESSGAPLLVPPFKREVFAGEVFRAGLVQGQALKLTFDGGNRGGVVLAIPVKDKTALAEKEVLKSGVPAVMVYSAGEADGVAVRVFTGAGSLTGELEPMDEKTVSEGETAEFAMAPGIEAIGRFINVSDFRSSVTYEFFSGQTSVSRDAARSRTITLDFRGSSKDKRWECEGDKMVVKVHRGKMIVKAGQPFIENPAAAKK
ncbi:hypothetical protein EPN96_11475 [bacterium]|nr:MAG: hypothetical protein EPN96_11475 [bacterium]